MSFRKAPVVGILLVYYPEYFERSVARFTLLLRKIERSAALVIVRNGSRLASEPRVANAIVLDGDNAFREFSGWKVGIDYCRKSAAIDGDALFILANDTFCYHNKFGPVTEAAFVAAFRRMLKRRTQLAIGGELHGDGMEMCILDKPFRRWVTTYLFAITSPLLAAIGDLAIPCDMNAFFEPGDSSKGFLTGPLNSALRRHVENWLFNTSGRSNWYGAGRLTAATRASYIGKAKSILLEMHLSASCAQMQAAFVSVFATPIVRQLRRLERLLDLLPGHSKVRTGPNSNKHDRT